jgi:hypothetical protein
MEEPHVQRGSEEGRSVKYLLVQVHDIIMSNDFIYGYIKHLFNRYMVNISYTYVCIKYLYICILSLILIYTICIYILGWYTLLVDQCFPTIFVSQHPWRLYFVINTQFHSARLNVGLTKRGLKLTGVNEKNLFNRKS